MKVVGGGLLGGGSNAGFVTGPSVSLAVALGNREVPLVEGFMNLTF